MKARVRDLICIERDEAEGSYDIYLGRPPNSKGNLLVFPRRKPAIDLKRFVVDCERCAATDKILREVAEWAYRDAAMGYDLEIVLSGQYAAASALRMKGLSVAAFDPVSLTEVQMPVDADTCCIGVILELCDAGFRVRFLDDTATVAPDSRNKAMSVCELSVATGAVISVSLRHSSEVEVVAICKEWHRVNDRAGVSLTLGSVSDSIDIGELVTQYVEIAAYLGDTVLNCAPFSRILGSLRGHPPARVTTVCVSADDGSSVSCCGSSNIGLQIESCKCRSCEVELLCIGARGGSILTERSWSTDPEVMLIEQRADCAVRMSIIASVLKASLDARQVVQGCVIDGHSEAWRDFCV